MQGPNVKRLIIHKMSVDAVPPDGGLHSVIEHLLTPGALQQNSRAATEWVNAAIAAVKSAPDNPFGDDDEAIAGEVLRRIEERDGKGEKRH